MKQSFIPDLMLMKFGAPLLIDFAPRQSLMNPSRHMAKECKEEVSSR